jgi:hypothetical protein
MEMGGVGSQVPQRASALAAKHQHNGWHTTVVQVRWRDLERPARKWFGRRVRQEKGDIEYHPSRQNSGSWARDARPAVVPLRNGSTELPKR